MCDHPSGCKSVRYEEENIVVDLACGGTLVLEVQDYETDEPLPHTFDGGGTKLWLTENDRLWLGVV